MKYFSALIVTALIFAFFQMNYADAAASKALKKKWHKYLRVSNLKKAFDTGFRVKYRNFTRTHKGEIENQPELSKKFSDEKHIEKLTKRNYSVLVSQLAKSSVTIADLDKAIAFLENESNQRISAAMKATAPKMQSYNDKLLKKEIEIKKKGSK